FGLTQFTHYLYTLVAQAVPQKRCQVAAYVGKHRLLNGIMQRYGYMVFREFVFLIQQLILRLISLSRFGIRVPGIPELLWCKRHVRLALNFLGGALFFLNFYFQEVGQPDGRFWRVFEL